MKRCGKCTSLKYIGQFDLKGDGKRRSLCKECLRKKRGRVACPCGRERPPGKRLCLTCAQENKRRAGRAYRKSRKALNSWPIVLDFLFEISGGKCGYCDVVVPEDQRTADHIIPLSKGGEHRAHNLVACCRSCNAKKADRSVEEFLAAS